PDPPRWSGSRSVPKPARFKAETWSNGFSSLRSRSFAPAPIWASRSAHSGEPGRVRVTRSTEVMAWFYRYGTLPRTALDHAEPKNLQRGTMCGDDDERQASPGARQAGCVARRARGATADPAGWRRGLRPVLRAHRAQIGTSASRHPRWSRRRLDRPLPGISPPRSRRGP